MGWSTRRTDLLMPPWFGDVLSHELPFDLSRIRGQDIRLRFRLIDADVYALRFSES
jgi:hypothetical protein